MAVDYTTTALLAAIRRHAMLPGPSTGTNTDTLDDTDLLAMATEELWSYVVPTVMSVNEEYFVTVRDDTTANGTAAYSIPEDAISGALRDIQIRDGDRYKSLARIEPEREGDLWAETGTPTGYRLQGNSVILIPTPSVVTTLRFKYFKRPGKLVSTADCTSVTAAGSPYELICAATPLINQYTRLSFVLGVPPFNDPISEVCNNQSVWMDDGDNSDVILGGPDLIGALTVDQVLSLHPEAADSLTAPPGGETESLSYVCTFGTSCIPQIPPEFHPLLALRTAQVALESLGDPRSEALEKRCERMKAGLLQTIVPRARGKGRVVINPYAPGARSPRWRRFR